MMDKMKISAAVVGLFLAGAFFGGFATVMHVRVNTLEMRQSQVEAGFKDLQAAHQSVLKELNEKILPAVQAEIAKVAPKK